MADNSLDEADIRLLNLLQHDASLTNQALAALAHMSPATALRRVKRLRDLGIIERTVAILSPMHEHGFTPGLSAIVEVTLDQQNSEAMARFEAHAININAVQQCYRVSPGPDFVLILQVADMPAYTALAHQLLTAQFGVRNVRTFFSTHRAKFDPSIKL